MTAGWVIHDAVPGDREAALSFWPHPDRFDRRLASAAIGDESFLVAVPDDPARPPDDAVRAEGPGHRGPGEGGPAAAVGAVAGIAGVRWGGGCADTSRPLLYALEVRPELRGRGVGTGLIRHVAGLVVGRGFAEITLEVEVDNAGAIRLYRRLGFEMIGPHQHFWYFGKVSGSVEVLIMHGRAGHLAHR